MSISTAGTVSSEGVEHRSPALARLYSLHADQDIVKDHDGGGEVDLAHPLLTSIRRAWPAPDGGLICEGYDAAGLLRAGSIDAQGNAWVAPYATDKKLPTLCPPYEATLAVHRLGKRAVVIGRDEVTKYLRRGKAQGIADATSVVSRLCERAGLGSATVTGVGEAHLSFSLLPGRTLHSLAEEGLEGWKTLEEHWPALAEQHADLPLHAPEKEAHVLRTWYKHALRHDSVESLGLLGMAVDEVCAELSDAERQSPQDQWVSAHRDLHDKQLLWDGFRLSVLDLDTAARAEAALDLGNLRAHMELRMLQGRFPATMRSSLMDTIEVIANTLEVPQQRLATYEKASRLRLAFVYSFRPSAQQWLADWVEATLSARWDC
ncbi:serine kinase [Schaalia sp. Marseille-Q2122]|uniref:serine kinase n=1 Tax=Schaalia sp. Marseille-Q2122 TaxID=2736604 RepID=UPI00158C8991|nr:serine kinase [Schaalia sp. Marseille-Q2122]